MPVDIVGYDELVAGGNYDLISGYEDEELIMGYDGNYYSPDEIMAGLSLRGIGRGIGRAARGVGRVANMAMNPLAAAAAARRAIMPRRPQPNPYAAAMQQAAAMKQANAGVIVRDQAPTKARRLILPMSSTGTIAAGVSATITARPQTIAFKPQRVVVPSTIGPDFLIDDIKVGNVSQFVQSGSVSAESFQPNLDDGEMDMDTVQTSQDFVMQVTNVSGAARTFRATIYGRSAS